MVYKTSKNELSTYKYMFSNLWMVVQNDMCKRISFRRAFPFFSVRYNSTKTQSPTNIVWKARTLYEKHEDLLKSFTVFVFYSMYLLNFKEYMYMTVLDRLGLEYLFYSNSLILTTYTIYMYIIHVCLFGWVYFFNLIKDFKFFIAWFLSH